MTGYTQDFEEDVLAQSLRNTEYLRKATPVLDSHHFMHKEHGWVWGVVSETWKEFAERAGPKVLVSRAQHEFAKDKAKRELHIQIILDLFKRKIETPMAKLKGLRQFVRDKAVHVAIDESLDARDKGDTDGAVEALRKMVSEDIAPSSHSVVDWMETLDDRQRERKHRKEHPDEYPVVATGFPTLDRLLGGGARDGEVCLVVSTTGRGKSIFLMHLGYVAITHPSHPCNVLHITLEMSAEQVATRYDSRFTGKAHGKFKGFDFTAAELEEIEAKAERNKARLASRLRIISLPLGSCNIGALRAAIADARTHMPKIDMLLVDSGDHMKGTGRFESKRLEQAQIYWELKALAADQSMVLWSSTQAGREWEKKIAGAEAVSESYDKARIADLVVTLNEPSGRRKGVVSSDGEEDEDEHKEEESAGDLSLFVAKYRDGESKVKIPLDADFAHMVIREATGGKHGI